MKKSNKKFIASLLAISLAAPVFSGIPVFAENSDGTIVDQTQPLTVVGKRITGDDTYFEISLEVNGDYDEYSSVGVVLRYDPDYIIPAESWDEDAGAADMSENTSWATRRALPTLGLETWSTHTALAYQEDAPAAGSAKKYGYLYLGAEHPLGVETPAPDPSASPDPTADPSASTPEPTASPTPGTRPVVVARFMYNTDAAAVPPVTGKDTREKLENDWLNGVNGSGAAQPTNWDYDWTSNAILRIASDEVSGKSPAQYPFAIYTQDYEEKAYMETWPAVTPTVTPAPGAPTPTPMPVSAYAPVIGAGIDTANHLTRNDIMIITCVGESAKATGGLKLSDIFVILFYDWDDTLLGTLTTGVGVDATEAVNNYVEAKFIHPDLRTTAASPPDYTTLAATGVDDWKERQWSYRGEFPYTGPNATNPTEPGGPGSIPEEIDDGSGTGTMMTNPNAGSNYPLTNKLDYTFAGKDIDPDHPFSNGWTQVTPKSVNYDATKYPSTLMYNAQPKAMADAWTALSTSETFDRVKFNSAGVIIDPDTGAVAASQNLPTYISYDFSDVKAEDLANSDGNLYVKAVYKPGEKLNYYLEEGYTIVPPLETTVLSSIAGTMIYSIMVKYRRINNIGYGVTRIHKPGIQMELKEVGAKKSTYLGMFPENTELIETQLTPTDAVETVGYVLRDTWNSDVVLGNARSISNALGIIEISSGEEGGGGGDLWWSTVSADVLDAAYNDCAGSGGPEAYGWLDPDHASYSMKLCYDEYGTPIYDETVAADVEWALMELMNEVIAAGDDYHTLTWFQLQYAILDGLYWGSGQFYVSNDDAKAAVEACPDVMAVYNG